jgi:hypothetical protein
MLDLKKGINFFSKWELARPRSETQVHDLDTGS